MKHKGAERQKNQLELAFTTGEKGEALNPGGKRVEAPMAGHETESPATTEFLMEEACEHEKGV